MIQSHLLKEILKESFLRFQVYFFKARTGENFIVNWHHYWYSVLCEAVYKGDIQNLIINVPPGSTKCVTEGTYVLTLNGYVLVEDLKVNDFIYSFKKGELCSNKIINKETFRKACIEITTENEKEVSVSYDHPVLTSRGWICACDLTYDDSVVELNTEFFSLFTEVTNNNIDFLKLSLLKNSNVASFVYSKIKKLKSIGKRNVYHLGTSAPDYNDRNFIANGIVVHNTDTFSVSFPAWCFAKNPKCRFLETSYSEDRVEENSMYVKDIINTQEFKKLFPGYSFKADSNKKKEWSLEYNGKAVGKFTAIPTKGQLTGNRAGFMSSGFSGAIIIDDPLKPEDAWSKPLREKANRIITNTIASRKAVSTTPIILIMQRIHEDDPTGFLLKGGSGDKWNYIKIPAIIDHKYAKSLLDTPFSFLSEKHLLPLLEKNDEISYWEYKEPLETLNSMKNADSYTFSSQYMQEPTPAGGGMFKSDWWIIEETYPAEFDYVKIVADTAQKIKEHNDYSVFLAYGVKNKQIYIINLLRGKWEAPELIQKANNFYKGAKKRYGDSLRGFYIEDKVSGTGLIQTLKKETKIPVVAVNREKDKVSRAHAAAPYVESGRIHLPESVSWLNVFLTELSQFTEVMTHQHDDIVDCLVTAIEIEYIKTKKATVKTLSIY